MLVMLEDTSFERYRPRLKKWTSTCTAILATVLLIILIIFLVIFSLNVGKKVHIVYILGSNTHTTDEKFLSIALDTSIIANNFTNLDLTNPRIVKLLKALAPAYLRIGGTLADRLFFTGEDSHHLDLKHLPHDDRQRTVMQECSFKFQDCVNTMLAPNFTMNGKEWLSLHKFASSANMNIIFDLNSLRRFDNGTWDYRNAEDLLTFSAQHNLQVNWELGNEPNSYRHQFNYDVNASQLSQDFQTLRNLLSKYSQYAHSLLVGPDVTRPQLSRNDSILYLREFLKGNATIDAITWHQYYFNGATATIVDFLDPQYFEMLEWQITTILDIVKNAKLTNLPIWLGETSSAYGGGAPHLSDRFVASFLWLDKLGVAAKYGLSVVIRQSFFQGHYALVNNDYDPTPDWWVSVLYKKLVGNKVVSCRKSPSRLVRLYCHCTKRDDIPYVNASSVTVFGVNISNRKAKIRFEGLTMDNQDPKKLIVDSYILTTEERIDSKLIYLNDVLLSLSETNDLPDFQPRKVLADPFVEMPAYSMAFWVLPASNSYC